MLCIDLLKSFHLSNADSHETFYCTLTIEKRRVSFTDTQFYSWLQRIWILEAVSTRQMILVILRTTWEVLAMLEQYLIVSRVEICFRVLIPLWSTSQSPPHKNLSRTSRSPLRLWGRSPSTIPAVVPAIICLNRLSGRFRSSAQRHERAVWQKDKRVEQRPVHPLGCPKGPV